jgi:hypothetical protein
MTEETNNLLRELPITLLTPIFEKSSKAKAMQYAMDQIKEDYDYVVILDADNVVESDFLEKLNDVCNKGYKAIQCHRCAKNSNNDIAVLDGVSEEINNTIFRKAHNRIGLSSALIGSGMCFDFKWFKKNVYKLSTAGEDRELEALLLMQEIYIHYEESIPVFDEKVSNKENFQKQRLRWMTAQIQSLFRMLPYIPHAIITGNIDFIDKTVQQALIPRSMLIVLTFMLACFITLLCLRCYCSGIHLQLSADSRDSHVCLEIQDLGMEGQRGEVYLPADQHHPACILGSKRTGCCDCMVHSAFDSHTTQIIRLFCVAYGVFSHHIRRFHPHCCSRLACSTLLPAQRLPLYQAYDQR